MAHKRKRQVVLHSLETKYQAITALENGQRRSVVCRHLNIRPTTMFYWVANSAKIKEKYKDQLCCINNWVSFRIETYDTLTPSRWISTLPQHGQICPILQVCCITDKPCNKLAVSLYNIPTRQLMTPGSRIWSFSPAMSIDKETTF